MKPRHDARLVPAALLAYGCAALVTGEVLTPGAMRWLVALGVVLATVGGLACVLVPGGSTSWIPAFFPHAALAGTMVALVACLSAAHMDARWQGDFELAVSASTPVELVAVVRREPVPLANPGFDGTERHRVEVAAQAWRASGVTEIDLEWRPSGATVEVIGGRDVAALAYGDHVALTTNLSRLRGDRAVAIGWDAQVDARTAATGISGAIATIREDFRAATAQLPAPVLGLSRGMVIGDTRAMPAQQREDMRVAGLAHLTAVSGAHFAVVAVLLHGVLRRLRLRRAVRAFAAALGMLSFALLVFPDASVVRALVMALVGAVAVLWGRPPHALPALATAVIVLVCCDPFIALEVGFALSVSAVASIVLWAPRLRVILVRFMAPTPALLVSVPLAAQAACAPILILLEPRVSLYSVGANLLASPLAAPVTLVGLGAVLIGPISHTLATWTAWVASTPAWPVSFVARTTATLPGTTVSWPGGLAGGLSLAALTAVVMWWTSPRGSHAVKALCSVVALSAVLVAGRADRAWEWANSVPSDWAFVACDVGQGDMELLRVDDRSAVVIDTGPGDGSAAACLRRYGVSRIPLLILSHPHADHDGGVSEVLAAASVETAWVPRIATMPGFDGAAVHLRDGGVHVLIPDAHETWRVPQVSVALLHASEVEALPVSGEQPDGTVLNDASLVVYGVTHGVSVLALGDVEQSAQQELEETVRGGLSVDVVKVPHHGSRVQDADLASRIEASIAVVSVGAANTYGHPADSTLGMYGGNGARAIRTDECADIVVWREEGLRMASECP